MADALLMTARELNDEGKAKNLFPQVRAIHNQPKGYPELDKEMVAFAKSEGGLQTLAEEYHTFLAAYNQDRSIMRFRLSPYNTHRIGVVLDGLEYPERHFTVQPDFLRQCKMFITQDEIDRYFLKAGVDSRLSVYSHFCYPHTPEERQKHIKSGFGEYSGGSMDGYSYERTSKGLTLRREYARMKYDEVKLSIPNVVKTYERLIAQKRFPGEDAIAQIPQYELGRLARTVYHGFYDAPDEIPRPYPKGADFYDAVPAIEAQLPDKAKAAEILDTLTTRLDSLQEGDRYPKRKITGFLALYFRYVYLLRGARRAKPSHRAAFPKREEVTKLERYEKQFRYLMEHDINPGAETYEHNGSTWIIYQAELPLSVEDLQDVKFDGYLRENRHSESIFLGQKVVWQHPRRDIDTPVNVPDLKYTLTIIKVPALYDVCKERILNRRSDTVVEEGIIFVDHYEKIDATPWLAEEAYQLHWSEGILNKYFLCYEDRIIEIDFDWEPTEEQMRIVAEKLAFVD